jgi:hypothetical protein
MKTLEFIKVPRGAFFVYYMPVRETSRWVSVPRKRPWGVFKRSVRGLGAGYPWGWFATEAAARADADKRNGSGVTTPAGVVGWYDIPPNKVVDPASNGA